MYLIRLAFAASAVAATVRLEARWAGEERGGFYREGEGGWENLCFRRKWGPCYHPVSPRISDLLSLYQPFLLSSLPPAFLVILPRCRRGWKSYLYPISRAPR